MDSYITASTKNRYFYGDALDLILQICWYKDRFKKKNKNDFEKYSLKLILKAAYGDTTEKVRKHRDIKLVTTERRRNYLLSKPNHHTTKFFTGNLLATEMKKRRYLVKPVYLVLSILFK